MTPYEQLVAWCRENGISCSRGADRYGYEVWSRKGVTLKFTKAIGTSAAEMIRIQAIRNMSMAVSKPKRARARETAAKRSAARAKRLRELEVQIALRNRELGGLRANLSSEEARAIIRVIEGHEREFRALRAQMTSVPAPNSHADNVAVRHVSKQY